MNNQRTLEQILKIYSKQAFKARGNTIQEKLNSLMLSWTKVLHVWQSYNEGPKYTINEQDKNWRFDFTYMHLSLCKLMYEFVDLNDSEETISYQLKAFQSCLLTDLNAFDYRPGSVDAHGYIIAEVNALLSPS